LLFHNGQFSPELLPDPRARAVLTAAVTHVAIPVRGWNFLAAAIASGDATIVRILSQALPKGVGPEKLIQLPGDGQSCFQANDRQPNREAFSPAALRSLDEFQAVLRGSGGVFSEVALELLLHFVLSHLEEDEKRVCPEFDATKAAALFRDHVVRVMDPRGTNNQEFTGRAAYAWADRIEPFQLPSAIVASEDLTYRASQANCGRESPFDGEPTYEVLFDEICRAMHRRHARHVLLTGERGVGKLTVVAELARRVAFGKIPFLSGHRVISIDFRHVPPDESRQRLGAVLAHLANQPELIICVDGFPALLRGERVGINKSLLLGELAHAGYRLLGLLTPRDFDELIADDPEFGEYFVRVDVPEPDPEVAVRLLQHLAIGLTDRFGVVIESDAINQAVVLSANYILNDQLPSKSLRLLATACEEALYERSQLGRARERVTADDILHLVSEASGVPEETLRGIAGRVDYEQSLKDVIFGQDQAVRDVATELGLIKAGMTDPTKPASVILFLGQTGTGKTEMAKALARFYSTSKRLKTYTLGNCVEPHSVSTIIGVPPGYVGHDQGGRLVNDLNADPYCVFLLDEADKAHPDVLQPFLNLFDEGWVSDQRGLRAYGNKSIFILTSNVGHRMIAEMAQQGNSAEQIAAKMKEALSQIRHSKSDRPVFTPEFLARLKRIIVFNPLDRAAMCAISQKQFDELERTWFTMRNKRLEFPSQLPQHVGDEAHRLNEKSGGKEGGRIVRKLISEWVEARLQRAVSCRPEEYKKCSVITFEFTPSPERSDVEISPAPAIDVIFR
jgi:ATP-dependent Clp protease ATP-binding subunit ClpC